MSKSTNTGQKHREALSGKTQVIAVGLILAIIGSLIASSYAADTLTNYTGFAMLLIGIATCILGVVATAVATLKMQLSCDVSLRRLRVRMPKVLIFSVWAAGVGVVLVSVGFLLGTSFARYELINDTSYSMLLSGTCILMFGLLGAAVTTLHVRRVTPEMQSGVVVGLGTEKPKRARSYSRAIIALGVVVTLAGSIVASSYAKELLENYAGFGMLLVGIAILTVGITQTVVGMLKNRWSTFDFGSTGNEPRIVAGSIWAIGIGAMLVINGSLIASSYEKSTIMNYAGFGMLLAGTGVFVYGLFQTARVSAMSAMGYLTSRRAHDSGGHSKVQKVKLSTRLRGMGKNLVRTSAVLNLAGVMFAIGLLFFSLWQLDLIVSGPVWWQSSEYGAGWSWPGPGAYANDYFQCFLWKTTIGQAYDTLFLLIFISFIVLFASAFFWPRFHNKNPEGSGNEA